MHVPSKSNESEPKTETFCPASSVSRSIASFTEIGLTIAAIVPVPISHVFLSRVQTTTGRLHDGQLNSQHSGRGGKQRNRGPPVRSKSWNDASPNAAFQYGHALEDSHNFKSDVQIEKLLSDERHASPGTRERFSTSKPPDSRTQVHAIVTRRFRHHWPLTIVCGRRSTCHLASHPMIARSSSTFLQLESVRPRQNLSRQSIAWIGKEDCWCKPWLQ